METQIRYRSAILPNLIMPFMMVTSTLLQIPTNESPSLPANIHKFTYKQEISEYFNILPDYQQKNINNEADILHKFLSKLIIESKDLDSELVEMVNNNFGDLLLKI